MNIQYDENILYIYIYIYSIVSGKAFWLLRRKLITLVNIYIINIQAYIYICT
jgi:hypothetical protein